MCFLWFLSVFLLFVVALSKNHTVDDTSPRINCYGLGPANGLIWAGCEDRLVSQFGFDPSRIFKHTVTTFPAINKTNGVPANGLELNFTGTAFYIFIAVPETNIDIGTSGLTPYPAEFSGSISLDGGPVSHGAFTRNSPASTFTVKSRLNEQYLCLWFTTGIPDGPHTVQVDSGGNPLMFDYAVYTRRRKRTEEKEITPAMEESGPRRPPTVDAADDPVELRLNWSPRLSTSADTVTAQTSLVSPTTVSSEGTIVDQIQQLQETKFSTSPGNGLVIELADQVRVLTEQVQQLQQRSATDPEPVAAPTPTPNSLQRFLSTMNREQTRALADYARDPRVTDNLVHTDRGLQLTAGRVMDKSPPAYARE
ncbi:hypothetical protein C8R46DRAFT_1188782 [Mycena filopes]|nr:hypothetical protein C8R46DRAFT_1188782 [Mycena filopes]